MIRIRKRTLTSSIVVASIVGLLAVGLLALAWGSTTSRGQPKHYSGPELAKILAEDADQDVKQVLADGVVTFDEYESTVERTAQCMEAEGIVVIRPPGQAVGGGTHLR